MKKTIYLLFLITFMFSSNIWALTWKISEITGYSDTMQPDGDRFGNSNVWYYQGANAGDYDPRNYANLVYSIDHWGYMPGVWVFGDIHGSTSVGMHPGSAWDALVRFTVQQDNYYNIHLRMYDSDIGNYLDSGVAVIFQYGNVDNTIYTEVRNMYRGGEQVFDVSNVFLKAGDIIVARVNQAGDLYYDSTGISDFTISSDSLPFNAVPEPATLCLFLVSVFGLAKRLFHKK